MADKEIDDLTAASTLTGAEKFHVLQGGNSRKTTVADVAAYTGFTKPVVADFAWINQGSATASDTSTGLVLSTPGSGSGAPNMHILKKTAPATPYTITAYVEATMYAKNFNACGLCFRQSSDGKLHGFDLIGGPVGATASSAIGLRSTKLTSATVFSADYQNNVVNFRPNWLRIADNGTNRICSWSMDGTNWIVHHTIGRTDFLTADEVGFWVGDENAATPNMGVICKLMHWLAA